jgi:hypothetical protein
LSFHNFSLTNVSLGPRCNLLVAYQSDPYPAKKASFVYIVKGALSLIQGEVPADAFDGEEE